MPTWMDMRYHELRASELYAEAAQARLASALAATQRPSRLVRLYGPLMVRTGTLLEHWGVRLKTRYATFSQKQRQMAEECLHSLCASPLESGTVGK